MRTTSHREHVLNLIREERVRQIEKYGLNDNLLLGFGSRVSDYPWLTPYSDANGEEVETVFRADYIAYEHEHGDPTWMHLIREEVAELFATRRVNDTLDEAIQVAALCISLCERLMNDREPDTPLILLGQDAHEASPVNLSDENRMLLYRAYDAGDGRTVTLRQYRDTDTFTGFWEGEGVVWGTEVDGVLYSICFLPGGKFTVLVGDEIVNNVLGKAVESLAEAWAYIESLATK